MKRVLLMLLVLFALILAILVVTGCISSVGKEYFQLYLPQNTARAADGETTCKIDKVLLVEPVEVDPIYNDYRIVYRTSPFHLNYYSYKYWIKKPEAMIRDAIVDYFSKNNVFKKVVTGFAQGEPDIRLKAVVHILEEYDRPGSWFAQLKMDIRVIDFKTGEPVLSHSFERERQLTTRKIEHLPIAISGLLHEELNKMIRKLVKK
ncbi:MAG: ABC-type transport auxiliary lipoprotein family protein [Candidatus Aminicenantes bacterium]|jgi:uncharacterized lipoprotein YmbA